MYISTLIKRSATAALAAAAFFCSCTTGEISYTERIFNSSENDAKALIDRGYQRADSISLAEGNHDALMAFADSLGEAFFAVNSNLKNDVIYSWCLDREEKCLSLEPSDYRKIAWKRSLLERNGIGRLINNIPLVSESGEETFLHDLITRKSLLIIYGEKCNACKKLISEVNSSKTIRKAAENGEVNLIAIYTGEDQEEFRSIGAELKGWENYMDYDGTIKYEQSFDTRLVPSLYLVSENRIVRLKGSTEVKEIDKALRDKQDGAITILLKPGEKVWGGRVADGNRMPFESGFETTMHANSGNQVQPLLLSSEGRYVVSDGPFDFKIMGDSLIISSHEKEIDSYIVANSLSGAFNFASRSFFPADGNMTPVEFFEKPQYNTWIELQYNQNQADVLEYAKGIIDHGLPPGIIMIDDTWMEDYGKWVFHPGRFPDPKSMCKQLHDMGFKIMLWVCPFVSMDQYQIWAELCGRDAFVKTIDGRVYPVEWWNGVSAELDLSNPRAVEWFDEQLQFLMNEYGVDGFKFDAGDFNLWPDDGVTMGGLTNYQLCQEFAKFGERYPYNEFRASWKMGGKALVQRLHDKSHRWDALGALMPEMIAANLLGYYFSCPDMVGGGSFASFLPGCEIDQDLIVRSAQTHALMPMMQFSVAPWRILDKEHLNAVLMSVEIRKQFLPEIIRLMERAARYGEPLVTPLEFIFPHQGLADIKDEFMLGRQILVAPMVYPGRERTVALPSGTWIADDGKTYEGGQTITINVPLERIPYFKLKN